MKNLIILAGLVIILIPSCTKTSQLLNGATSGKDSSLPMELAYWQYYSEKDKSFKMPQTGRYVKTTEGLQVFAADTRAGARLSTNSEIYVNGKTAYIKWKFNGGGDFSDYKASLYYDKYSDGIHEYQKADFLYLTTKKVYNESALVAEDTWYYTRITFNNGIVIANTASKDYDNAGGEIIQTRTSSVPLHSGFLALRSYDNYVGSKSYFILGEYKLKNK
jgi:hypothetical protein